VSRNATETSIECAAAAADLLRSSTNPQDFIDGDNARRFTGHPLAATLFQYNDRYNAVPANAGE